MRELTAEDTLLISGGFLASDPDGRSSGFGGAAYRGVNLIGAITTGVQIVNSVGTAIGHAAGWLVMTGPQRSDGSFHCHTDPLDRQIEQTCGPR